MEERIDLVSVEEDAKPAGFQVSYSVLASVVLHVFLAIYLIRNYKPVSSSDVAVPMQQYVQLMKSDPRQFTEAPGKTVEHAPLNAPLSNANRKAAMPEPTGPKPTLRPGEGGPTYTPPPARGAQRPTASQQAADAAPQPSADAQPSQSAAMTQPDAASSSSLTYHQPAQTPAPAPANALEWRNAIRKVASLGGGQQSAELNGSGGGEKGFAESGQLSFESDWYDWGDYAESMVSRIRVNWYNNMPPLLQTGMQGMATIRFTIHRDGRITDVTILKSSGIPPYDFAAKKAIELSSPLNPLPKDFTLDTERVTCQFFYNLEPPR